MHPGNQVARTREVIKMSGPPRTVSWPTTWSPELLGPGKGKKHRPNRVCPFVDYPRN